MKRPLRITYTGNRMCTYVAGNGAKGLLFELCGRSPVWSSKHRAFVVTEATAADALASAEARGWFVLTAGTPAPPKAVQTAPEPPREADRVDLLDEVLW